ncbi:LysE family translocator [Amycolatopsis taiwanensis]|uniref:Lysine transporter LysE n=1 Tax=Amycolatopsis taiwanensis TaxID=342230 RepID=A0A9W6VGE2_9PSEU|nr:LysE family translocator [Amycolatopsis taiwanensis]GLY70688.1 lysine transporter LysE [Amycolatopsis taiwanensis]
MVDLHQLAAFCAMSLLLSAIPGPSVLFVIGRALAHGRRAALASVLGNAMGGYLLVVGVALGVGAVVERSVLLFNLIKLAGAAYLVFLGVKALWASWGSRSGATGTQPTPPAAGRSVWQGFTVGVTNPKSIIFLTAVLPQFVDREAGHVIAQMLLLGLAGAVLQLVSDGTWGLAASAARTWLGRSPRRMSVLGGTGGLAMIGLGATVALTGRAD